MTSDERMDLIGRVSLFFFENKVGFRLDLSSRGHF